MQLKALQQAFKNYLIAADREVIAEVAMHGELNALQGMSVYKNAYQIRLANLLKRALPKTLQAMGEVTFNALVRGYFITHPPDHFNAYELTQYLASYMQQCDIELWLVDLVHFELSMQHVMVADNVLALTIGEFSQLDETSFDVLQFQLHPQVALKQFAYRITDAWENPSTPPRQEAQSVVIWRSGVDAMYLELDANAWQVLLLLQGLNWQSWSDAVQAFDSSVNVEELLPAILQLALEYGWLLRRV